MLQEILSLHADKDCEPYRPLDRQSFYRCRARHPGPLPDFNVHAHLLSAHHRRYSHVRGIGIPVKTLVPKETSILPTTLSSLLSLPLGLVSLSGLIQYPDLVPQAIAG
jgi:hypothetical protein